MLLRAQAFTFFAYAAVAGACEPDSFSPKLDVALECGSLTLWAWGALGVGWSRGNAKPDHAQPRPACEPAFCFKPCAQHFGLAAIGGHWAQDHTEHIIHTERCQDFNALWR